MTRVKGVLWSGIALTLLLGACSLAPPLKTPVVPTADAYKEIGSWTQRSRADRLPRDSWWTLYDSAELDGLQRTLIDGNPTIAAALANYQQARALSDQARAGLFPTVSVNASATRNRNSVNAPLRLSTFSPYYNDNMVSGSVSYELDLWGQIRNQVAAGKANAAAAAADLENARLLLIAQLVDDYIQLRSLDRDSAILDETVTAYTRALSLTDQRHGAGTRPASTSRRRRLSSMPHAPGGADARPAGADGTRDCGAARRVGLDVLDQPDIIVDIKLPHIPTGVPATLVQRRPDIAGAQRRHDCGQCNIGVARAAYFPRSRSALRAASIANPPRTG